MKWFIAFYMMVMCCGACALGPCFPKTAMKLPASTLASGISEKAFNEDLDMVQKGFEVEVKNHGAELVFNRQWDDGTINSDTYEQDGKWIINSYGGLARYPGMTKDGYLAVACHELGHHLGGVPKYTGEEWASVEGEADYFATLRCLKELGLNNERIHDASMVLAGVLADLGGEPVPKPETPDPAKVRKTYEAHPQAQCRLDTYLSGGICEDRGPLSDSDAKVNSCWGYSQSGQKTVIGARPRCWFKP
jgi:hypothetical protein